MDDPSINSPPKHHSYDHPERSTTISNNSAATDNNLIGSQQTTEQLTQERP